MATPRVCPNRSARLPPGAPDGLCTECQTAETVRGGPSGSSTTGISPSQSETRTRVRYFGDYELLDEIARGGMGIVFKARQTSLKRIVALKLIGSGQLASKVEVQRFHAEAEAAANLQHPNIVAIHEVGTHAGQHYFSMDHVDGPDMARIIREKAVLPRQAAEWVKSLAEAIHYAHQRGILHRDLKPHNVLIDERGAPRITDFGLAKHTGQDSGLTRPEAIMGSPSYMSPEQAAGRIGQVGPASDIYSLGAILYELLTRRPPFKEVTSLATLRQVLETAPVRPTQLDPQVPADLETISLKCLEKHPARRYPTAQALAEDLGRFLRQQPILARRPSVASRAFHWLQWHPWILAGFATGLSLGLVCLAYGFWQQNRYLIFLHTHPSYVRAEGPLVRLAMALNASALLLFIVSAWLTVRYSIRSGRFSGNGFGLTAMPPRFTVSKQLRGACNVVATTQLLAGLALVLASIHAMIWETQAARQGLYLGSCSCWMAVALLWRVNREQRALASGLPAESAPYRGPEPIRLLQVWLWVAALALDLVFAFSVSQFSGFPILPVLGQLTSGWLIGIGFALTQRTKKVWLGIGWTVAAAMIVTSFNSVLHPELSPRWLWFVGAASAVLVEWIAPRRTSAEALAGSLKLNERSHKP